jgi:histidine phosphotransferase ChpT
MSETEIDFASLLCSRLCHDLLSPVGAMNNGIELLADEHDPDMRQRCMDLLTESAKAAADKLKFFRLAFGAAGGFGAEVDLVLLANDTLVRGGTLFVGAETRAGEQEIVIQASGPKILMDSAVREALTGQLDP